MNARRVLYVDAAGAAVSAAILACVLAPRVDAFGMPRTVALGLAAAPAAFLAWDLAHAARRSARHVWALRAVAYANASYAVVSGLLLVVHAEHLRPLGWAYFLGEIAVLVELVAWELRVAREDAT